jgi:hypothetical protein
MDGPPALAANMVKEFVSQSHGERNAAASASTDSYRILKTNRTEYLIVMDDGQDFEAMYAEWCRMDDAFCEGELPESKWQDIATFLRKRHVTVIEPFCVHVLADYYEG